MGMDFSEIEDTLNDTIPVKNTYAVVQEPYQKLYFFEGFTLLISLAENYTFFMIYDDVNDKSFRGDGEYTAADIVVALNTLNLI